MKIRVKSVSAVDQFGQHCSLPGFHTEIPDDTKDIEYEIQNECEIKYCHYDRHIADWEVEDDRN